MIDRRVFVAKVALGLLAAPFAAKGQTPAKIVRLGYLATVPREALIASPIVIDRWRELGYIEGQNLVIEYRHADSPERLRAFATELVALGVQVIYAANPYALRAAREATRTVPIVGFDYEDDPVAAGYAASLARPGGNVTGAFLDQPEVSAKQLQILKEIVPGLARVAVLWDAALATAQRNAVDDAGRRLGVAVAPIVWRGPDALPEALRLATQGGAQALVVLSSPRIQVLHQRVLADAVLKSRLPSIALTRTFAQNGLLVSYGPVQRDMYRMAATLVAKVLDGARPADIPIERPVRFELVINMKTAKALGLTIPQSLLLRADEAIE